MNAISAKCGHVKRRLKQGLPLKGKLLEFVLSVLPDGPANDAFLDGIAQKLVSGNRLTEYEYHILVEVTLLHVRLSAASLERTRGGMKT